MGTFVPDSQTGESLTWQNCKGGYFSITEENGLKVKGNTLQNGTPTPDAPMDMQCVKEGTEIICQGNNLFNFAVFLDVSAWQYSSAQNFAFYDLDFLEVGKRYTISAVGSDSSFPLDASLWLMRGEEYYPGTTVYLLSSKTPNSNRIYSFEATGNEFLRVYVPRVGGAYDLINNASIPEYISRIYLVEGSYTQETLPTYEPYFKSTILTPCDLYEGDVWYPATGKVVRENLVATIEAATDMDNVTYDKSIFRCSVPSNPCVDFTAKSNRFLGVDKSLAALETNECINIYSNSKTFFEWVMEVDTLEEMNAQIAEWNAGAQPLKFYCKLQEPVVENYTPQSIYAMQGEVHVLQTPLDLPATLSATMLVKGVG